MTEEAQMGQAKTSGLKNCPPQESVLSPITQEPPNQDWHLILNTIQDGFWVLDCEWRCVYLNDQQAQLLGLEPQATVGQSVQDILRQHLGHPVYDQLQQAIANRTPLQVEYFDPIQQRWFELRGYPSTQGFSMLTLDISDRKRQTEARDTTNQDVSLILESITDAFVTFDHEWRYTYVNHEAARMLQRSPETLIGQRWQDTVPDRSCLNPNIVQGLEQAAREQVAVTLEEFSVATNRWLELSIFPYAGGLAVYFRDISDRKQEECRKAAQYAVTQVLAEASTLVDAVPSILQALCNSLNCQLGLIWEVDADRSYLSCVNSWCAPTLSIDTFMQTNQTTRFAQGIGLPGRVWQHQQPIWVETIAEDPNFPRAEFALAGGLCSAFGFPIQVGTQIFGVIECFSNQAQAPDVDLLQMMVAVGYQIGQFMQRQRAEAALRESQALFQGFMDNSPMTAFIKDETGRYLYVNSLAEQIFQRRAADWVGATDFDIFPPEVAQQVSANDKLVFATNQATSMVEQISLPDGDRYYASFKFLLQDALGRRLLAGASMDITDRVRAEDALRMSDERFRLSARAVMAMIYDWDLQTGTVSYSEGLYLLLGLDSSQVPTTRKWWLAQIHPDDRRELQTLMQSILAENSDRYETEYRVRHYEGHWVDVWDRGYLIRDSQGQLIRVVGSTSDITERKRAENERHQLLEQIGTERELLEAVLQQMPAGVIVAEAPSGKILLGNHQVEQIWQHPLLSASSIAQYQNYQGFHPDGTQYQAHEWPLSRSITHGEVVTEEEIVFRRGDGSCGTMLVSSTPIRDRQGHIKAGVVTFSDISDRKQSELAQQVLAEASAALVSSLEYQTTLVNIAHLVVPALADYCFIDVVTPEQIVQRVAWHHRDASKRGWFDQVQRFVPPQHLQNHPVAKVLQSGQALLVSEITETWMQQAAHNPQHLKFMQACQPCSLMTVPFRARDRSLGALTLCMTTESNRHYTTADLALAEELAYRAALALDNAQLYQQAQDANRIKDEFLAVLSHELRSPLNPILGWTQLLRTGKLDRSASDRALETIERNARLQTQLIEDLLDISRILQGKMALNTGMVNLKTVIEAASETVRLAAEAKTITLHKTLSPDVGPVWGDASRLQQVIWNLLSNAVKFTPAGGQVEVRLEQVEHGQVDEGRRVDESSSIAAPHRAYAQITVRDTGKGISPAFLPHIFDSFRQEDSRITRSFGGLGLGLAIVRHLIELHGGTVRATSLGEGLGATFIAQLPLMPTPTSGAEPTDQHAPLLESLLLTGVQILIVDDEADMRNLLAAVLENYGATVQMVSSASEALAALEVHQPDLLISDVGMPQVDGYTFMQQIRQRSPQQGGNIPAIALTAYAGETNQQQALEAGFQMHLAKPVEPDTLVRAIAQLISKTNPADSSRQP